MAHLNDTIDSLIASGGDPLRVALIYGVVYPLTPSQTRVTQWLDRLAIAGGRIGPGAMKSLVAKLVAQGVLQIPADR